MEQANAPGTGGTSEHLRYAVDEDTPILLTLGLSAQVVTVVLTGIILIPIIVLTAARPGRSSSSGRCSRRSS